MALLNFKYGLHKNLPAFSDATIGNVFVTTDEQAMHIDLPGGGRDAVGHRLHVCGRDPPRDRYRGGA